MNVLSAVVLLAVVCCAVREAHCCFTSGECAANECCVSDMRPIGKRQFGGGGTCQSLGGSGDGCLVSTSAYDASRSYYYCPCQAGLTCKGNGMIDIPLGETGTCA